MAPRRATTTSPASSTAVDTAASRSSRLDSVQNCATDSPIFVIRSYATEETSGVASTLDARGPSTRELQVKFRHIGPICRRAPEMSRRSCRAAAPGWSPSCLPSSRTPRWGLLDGPTLPGRRACPPPRRAAAPGCSASGERRIARRCSSGMPSHVHPLIIHLQMPGGQLPSLPPMRPVAGPSVARGLLATASDPYGSAQERTPSHISGPQTISVHARHTDASRRTKADLGPRRRRRSLLPNTCPHP